MRRILAIVSLVGAWIVGCQSISGVNDLKVVDDDGTGGNGGSDGGTSGSGGTSGGSGGSSGASGADGSGGSTGGGGSTGSGGSGGSTLTTGSTSSGGTGGQCSDQPGWQCDILSNCGCSETENCGYDANSDRAECERLGTTEPYHVCQVNADCTRGHGCIAGVCKKHCVRASDCGWDQAACLEVYDGDVLVEGIGFCSEECDPVNPSVPRAGGVACDDDSICYAYTDDEGNLAHTVCIGSEGEGVQGDTCENADGDPDPRECAAGYNCNTVDETCRRFCEFGNDDCEEGTCVGYDPPAYLDDVELGSCTTCETGDFECSVYPECGCDNGAACKITDLDTGATECLPAGAVPAWGSCSVQGDCAPSAGACVAGFCRPYCEEPGSDSCNIGDCFQAYTGDTPVPGAYYCDAPCEPVLADRGSATNRIPCEEGTTCIPVSADPVDLGTGAFCAASDGLGEGASCDANSNCADGYGCLDNRCTPYCRNSADCTDTYPVCYDLTEPIYAGPGDDLGQCFTEEG